GGAACDAAGREPAVRAYGEQWLHFLHTQNWATLGDVLVEPCGRGLRALAGHQAAGPEVSVLPLAPEGSGLIGAGVYALAGTGGSHLSIWAT
ncbi:unnamed protein product, partial [Prorocentrum cordatum]